MGVGVGEADGVGITSGVAVGVGLTTGTTFTPLFHTNFFPDLMQVYFTPFVVDVAPNLLQLCPLFTAADAIEKFPAIISTADIEIAENFLPNMD